jgi:hypothetical protein
MAPRFYWEIIRQEVAPVSRWLELPYTYKYRGPLVSNDFWGITRCVGWR